MPYDNIISRSKISPLQTTHTLGRKRGGTVSPIITLLEGKKKGGKK